MGHVRNYTFGDLIVRYRTMQGHAVLSPMGFDCFGLPAENAAIKTGRHPRGSPTSASRSCTPRSSGSAPSTTGAARSRSHDPDYIRWTQWIFLRFLEAGLAYRTKAPVNWCPGCQTVLANEQVLADGTCERSGDLVEKRDLEQWFFKITDYAQQLLDDLDGSTGPSGSRPCSATGSAGPRAPSSTCRWSTPTGAPIARAPGSRCSPPGPTPASA